MNGDLSCDFYNTEDQCVKGERRGRCEWLELFGCQERTEPEEPKPLSGPECAARTESKDFCEKGAGCMYDGVTGQCHASPTICDRIRCGEERGEPLECLPPLKKFMP